MPQQSDGSEPRADGADAAQPSPTAAGTQPAGNSQQSPWQQQTATAGGPAGAYGTYGAYGTDSVPGQVPYGQGQYGQNPYNQTSYAQVSYGQPANGQYPPQSTSYYPYPSPANNRWNGLCIAGFVTSFIVPPVGLVLSIVALVQINKSQEKSKGMSIAGIVIGALGTVLLALFIGLMVWAVGYAINQVDTGDLVCSNGECHYRGEFGDRGFNDRGHGSYDGTDDDFGDWLSDPGSLSQQDMRRLLEQYGAGDLAS
ncbi:DUF4190 domain-containing protein [Bifidobacterium pullorum subsp. saeculare]|uniref:DUF4190 domain-containing protein n=2 Tax=Bifidobacterium pullorum TaxID=78448 RepID=A0A939BAD2_9BIFI|nr:DUF4190 domain-containing protein [Bifidobacterium pullorum subsp. saeculare]